MVCQTKTDLQQLSNLNTSRGLQTILEDKLTDLADSCERVCISSFDWKPDGYNKCERDFSAAA
jgi:hypothetical protein